MKRIALLALFVCSSLVLNAQGKYITDAALAYNASDFVGAQKALDKAWEIILQKRAAGEKVKDLNKYFKLKVQTYVRLADIHNTQDSALAFADTANYSATVYYKIDPAKYYDAEVKDGMIQLTYYYQNIGVYYYQKAEFEKAFDVFDKVIVLQKQAQPEKIELSAYHNAAFASFNAKLYNKSIPYLNTLIDSSYNKQNSLVEYKRSLVRSFLEYGDTASALNRLKMYNTGDTIMEFLKEEVSILLSQNKQQEALTRMQIMADQHLNDPIVYENIAKIYQQMGEYEKSKNFYTEALKIDDKRTDSHYGLGALSVLESNKLAGEKQKVKLREAIVELEKARALSPNDHDTLKALFQIYTNLEMTDKAKEIKAILQP
jgi:tetratricopeptide (TPR) repeat protein